MKKSTKSTFALAVVAATLCSCSLGKKNVEFWTPFGALYEQHLEPICESISSELGYTVHPTSQRSYPGVKDAMVAAIASATYPDIVVGYPDHFAQYHGSKILVPLDELVSEDMLKDFDENYMPENKLWDADGTQKLYGLPFNKSTELLGYNGVFVEYCNSLYPDKDLLHLPETWAEWAAYGSDTSKAYYYNKVFNDLIDAKAKLWCTQDAEGHASNFTTNEAESAGKTLVLNYSAVNSSDKDNYRLFSWDSIDNAFITLVRQWGGKYTELPDSQHSVKPKQRKGSVLFASSDNLDKTIGMLKFFKRLHNDRIFATPGDLGGSNFSSDPFKKGMCMFVVCSSGGTAHNTDMWGQRFRSLPIPYNVVDGKDMKFVISQGANICMTKKANKTKAFAAMKALTTGKYQTEWTIKTGYFPASKSSESDPSYQAFLNGTDFSDELSVYKREGAITNTTYYSDKSKGWTRFVDDAFIGSAEVRTQVSKILPRIFENVAEADIDNDSAYCAILKDILHEPDFYRNSNLNIQLDDRVK